MQPLVRLENVSVAINGKLLLHGISWDLLPGQHWAFVGRNGSGKSTLLKLIRAELWPVSGRRAYYLNGQAQATTAIGVKERISTVSPELQERYLQQEWKLTACDVTLSGFANTEYVYIKPTPQQRARADSVVELLGIQSLLRRDVQQLSTGELRKVLIARALVGSPAVLILDEVCDGLDVRSRQTLFATIERIAQSGTQVLYATHRRDELVPSITNVLELENGRIVRQGVALEKPMPVSAKARRIARVGTAGGRVLVEIKNADVYLGRKRVLRNMNWKLRENEHWAVVGRNGAGKSTFLKLIAGDVHPAVGGIVRRWDFTPANTLWDVRRRIGFMSPELQANYRDTVTAEDAIASGFFSSVGLLDKPTPTQRRKVRALMKKFSVAHLSAKRVGEMSYGEFRKVLLLRALVHDPELLLCDEPFDGLDERSRLAFRDTLEAVARRGTQLVVVTHHVNELPACITNKLRLNHSARD